MEEYYRETERKIIKQRARCDYYCMRKGWRYFRYGLKKIKEMKKKKKKAINWIKNKEFNKKKMLFRKIKKILKIERKWLEKVVAEFNSIKKG